MHTSSGVELQIQAHGPSIGQHHAGVAPAECPAVGRSAVPVTDTDPCHLEHRSSG